MAKLLAIGLLCLISFEGGVCEMAFVSFMGEPLPNHGYVDLGRVGSAADGADSVQCHTDLESCCGTSADGASDASGNWFAPDDQQLGSAGAVYEVAGERRIDLRRNSSSGALSGMYRCEIDTVATGPGAAVREAVYVGLYANGGGSLRMEGGISLKVSSGRFTLTCVTTGGPATSVVWIRGSALVHGTRTTVLDDPATARYTHTLTVSGRLRSDFRCIVTNEISRAEASFIPGGVVRVSVDSTSTTAATVSWGLVGGVAANSFSLSYSNSNNTECFTTRDEITGIGASERSYTLTGLQEGTEYSVTITAVLSSSITFSKTVSTTTIPAVPSAAPTSVEVSGSTPSTITLQWGSVDCRHQNGEIVGYSVRYREEGNEREETVRIPKATVTLSGLKSSTRHTVSVAAINSNGVGPYTNTVAMTSVFGEDSLSVAVDSLSFTSATLSWTLATPLLTATSYSLSFSNTDNTNCFRDSRNITLAPGSRSRYTVSGLEEGTQYSATLTAVLSNGDSLQQSNMFTTPEAAPAVPPAMVGVSNVTTTSVTVQWGSVDCRHQNGEITGYSVRFGEEGRGREGAMVVLGQTSQQAVVSGLTPGRLHTVRVAAINSAGEGTYSLPIQVATHTTGSVETSSSSCTEALVMTGCIGFIVGVIATLLITLPACVLLRRQRGKNNRDAVEEEEYEKKETMTVTENSAYGSAVSTARNSYQEEVIYEHVK